MKFKTTVGYTFGNNNILFLNTITEKLPFTNLQY